MLHNAEGQIVTVTTQALLLNMRLSPDVPNLALEVACAAVFLNPTKKGCTNPGRHNAQATTFYTITPNMCATSVFMSPLAPRFLENLCTPASRNAVTILEIRSCPFPQT